MFRVTILGSSAAMPSRERGMPSIAVEREGELLIFDCGEGTQRQLITAKLSKYQPDIILISHCHGDHILGLFGLLLSMSLQGREKPVILIAPKKIKELINSVFSTLDSKLTYELSFIEAKGGILFRGKGYRIIAARASHQGEAFSYKIEEDARPGRFHPEKAIQLGIPKGPLWQKLQHGKSITINGKRISPEQVVDKPRKGRSFGYSGDTKPTKALARFFKGVDILVFDSTYTDEYSDEAKKFGHSTASQAAKLAAEASVSKLVLTHFSHRIGSIDKALQEAKRYHSDVVAAKDFDQFEIPLHD